MERITHRELRNQSGEILRRVEAGESFEVTNNGHLIAMLVPPRPGSMEDLVRRGEARAARADIRDVLAKFEPAVLPISTAEIIDDLRGRW